MNLKNFEICFLIADMAGFYGSNFSLLFLELITEDFVLINLFVNLCVNDPQLVAIL